MKKVLTKVTSMVLALIVALGVFLPENAVFAASTVQYSMASTMNVKVGESQKLKITAAPVDSNKIINVSWCNATASYISISESQFGSYFNEEASCKVTGKSVGTGTVVATVKEYDKTTKKYIRTVKLECKVKIGKQEETKPAAGGTTQKTKVPLTKIALNKSSAKMTAGTTLKLSVSYTPSNTTDAKTVKWTSSNTSVATVSNGKVTAKKAGTATITAKVGTHKATCKITVKEAGDSKKDEYQDVRAAYTLTNQFRTSKKVWQWNKNNKTKKYFNTNSSNKLTALKKSAKLEEVAKKRAKQIALYYGKTGELDHKRLDGKDWSTDYRAAVPSGMIGENIAYTWSADCATVMELWKEEYDNYDWQGHRRAMLNKDYNAVGIACYKYKNRYFWVQAFGYVK